MKNPDFKRIDGVVYKMPRPEFNRNNSVGLSEKDMVQILHLSDENIALRDLLFKVKALYFMSCGDKAHSGGLPVIESRQYIQDMTDNELEDHNIVQSIVRKAQHNGW